MGLIINKILDFTIWDGAQGFSAFLIWTISSGVAHFRNQYTLQLDLLYHHAKSKINKLTGHFPNLIFLTQTIFFPSWSKEQISFSIKKKGSRDSFPSAHLTLRMNWSHFVHKNFWCWGISLLTYFLSFSPFSFSKVLSSNSSRTQAQKF